MTIPTQNDVSYCPVGNSHDPTLGSGWHTIFNPPFNSDCDSLNNLHKTEGYSLDLVVSGATSGASPPSNPKYTIVHNSGVVNPMFEEQFSIYINWIDPSSSIQGIEIKRKDKELLFIKAAPSGTTTEGWLITDEAGGSFLNPIVNNLEWGTEYIFQLRTSYQFVGAGSIFSEWVSLNVFERNQELRRRNDKCAVETLESMEVRLSQNFAEIPKAYRYSKIVKGGSRQVVCKTWRPQGWRSGAFLKEDYPVTAKNEEEIAQKAIENAGRALCGGKPCISGDTGSELTKISSYTGGLIFGTAALNFQEGVNNQQSLQVYPCGKAMRRIGGKLPIN